MRPHASIPCPPHALCLPPALYPHRLTRPSPSAAPNSFASGEDPDYPVTELNFHSPQTRGWQSPRFCEYPQEIGIQFTDGAVAVSQVQLLAHQSKVASRIELFVGAGPEYFNCQFTRLGYLSLDSNERSGYKARELKSVYLKAKGGFMKFLLHKCHVNSLNLQNQVGLIALNILGAPQQARGAGPPPGYSGGYGGPGGGAGGAGYGGAPHGGNPYGGQGGSLIPRPGGTMRCVDLEGPRCSGSSLPLPPPPPAAACRRPALALARSLALRLTRPPLFPPPAAAPRRPG